MNVTEEELNKMCLEKKRTEILVFEIKYSNIAS